METQTRPRTAATLEGGRTGLSGVKKPAGERSLLSGRRLACCLFRREALCLFSLEQHPFELLLLTVGQGRVLVRTFDIASGRSFLAVLVPELPFLRIRSSFLSESLQERLEQAF